MKAPCKGCPDRTVEPNCHGTCRKYLALKMALDMARKRKVDEAMVDDVVIERASDWDRMTHAFNTMQSAKRARNRK